MFGCHRNQMIFYVKKKGCQIAKMLGFEGVGICMFSEIGLFGWCGYCGQVE